MAEGQSSAQPTSNHSARSVAQGQSSAQWHRVTAQHSAKGSELSTVAKSQSSGTVAKGQHSPLPLTQLGAWHRVRAQPSPLPFTQLGVRHRVRAQHSGTGPPQFPSIHSARRAAQGQSSAQWHRVRAEHSGTGSELSTANFHSHSSERGTGSEHSTVSKGQDSPLALTQLGAQHRIRAQHGGTGSALRTANFHSISWERNTRSELSTVAQFQSLAQWHGVRAEHNGTESAQPPSIHSARSTAQG